MSQIISPPTRHRIIELFHEGQNGRQISVATGHSYKSIRTLLQRYKSEGEGGLIPSYSNSGKRCSKESECAYRLVRLYKHYHQLWGVSYILLQIKKAHPDIALCGCRHYERRLKADPHAASNKLAKNTPLQVVYHPERSILPHDCWQIDAKERLTTLDGLDACYLTTSDVKSDATLSAFVFPLCPYQSSAN
jgi:hypothetical protein